MSMSENSIDFGELEIRFSRPRTVCFVSGSMFFSCRTCLISCMGFFIPSNSGTLSSVDHFGNCRFSSFCLTYGSRSEQSSSPLSNLLRAVRVERYISVGSRKVIRCLCRLAGRSPMPPSKTQKNSPHSFIKTPNGALMPFDSFRVGFPMIRRSPFEFRAVLAECFPSEGLAALDGRSPAKSPNGREKRSVVSRGRRILPAGAESRLKRIGQETNSAKKASETFCPASDDFRQGVLPAKGTPRTGLRNTDPGDRPRRPRHARPRREVLPRRSFVPKPEGLP